MAKTAWPVAADLTNRLTGLGIASLPTGTVAADMIAAAVSAWETATNYKPFLEGSSDDFTFDPPFDYILSLEGGFTTVTAVEVGGDAQVEGTDYWLLPNNAAAKKRPYTSIRFLTMVTGLPQTVLVTGKPGYSDEIPDDVWQAVLNYACMQVILVKNGYIGPISEVSQGRVKVKYASDSESSAVAMFMAGFDLAVARYRRVVFA